MGKGGGGKARTPVEDKDTIESSQMISVIDLWSEGQIYGLVDGLKSVRLDNTAVVAEDGSVNIPGVDISYNLGTEDQDYLDGFPQNASEISVGVEVKQSAPVIRTITDPRIDMLRINLYSRALFVITNDGDTKRTDLKMRVETRKGSEPWEVKARIDFIDQKSRNEFSFKAEIWDLPATPFDVRVVRETSDDQTGDFQQIQNSSFWRSYSQVINQKYRWPLTAYMGLKFDSKSFEGAIPRRNYIVRGMIVKVPSNYDPETRKYNGFWNGQFKAAYTNNPAWIVYDIIKNPRYGLGRRGINVEETEMYKAAQWCDQLVPDGRGGMEPRVTCNCYITEQRNAWDLITDIMSCFRAMPLWNGQQFVPSLDIAKDVVATYNNSNVINGTFEYSASSMEDRHSVIEVRYANKANNYEQDTVQITDDLMIEQYGWNVLKVEAFGTDTESQAYRFGSYLLETERLERKTVSFSTGAEGLRNLPGDVIAVADSRQYGRIIGGRILSVSEDRKSIEIDDEVEIPNNAETIIIVIGDDRKPVELLCTNNPGNAKVLNFSTTCPESLGRLSPWSLKINNSGLKLWRCVSVKENDDGTYAINCVEHVPEKNEIVDNGVKFNPPEETLYGNNLPPVENISVEAVVENPNANVRVYWDAPRTARQIRYNVRIYRSGNLVTNQNIDNPSFSFMADTAGTYRAEIRCLGSDGKLGDSVDVVFVIAEPSMPSDVSWRASNFTVTLRPIPGGLVTIGEVYEWFIGSTEQEVLAMNNNLGEAFVLNQVGLKPNTEYWFGVRAVNMIGRSAIKTVLTKTAFETESLEGLIDVALPKTDYIKEMNKDIEGLGELASLRVVDKNGGRPRVTGVYLNAGDAGNNIASVIDFVADAVSISSPDTLERWVYFDSTNRRLVLGGEIQAVSGRLKNVVIEENCVIEGKLSVANIEGYAMEGQSYEFNISNTGGSKTINYGGNAKIPVRLFGQVWARQHKNQKTRVTVNGKTINQMEVSVIVNNNGTVTTRTYTWLYTFVVDLSINQGAEIFVSAGSLDQGNSESSTYRTQFWIAPQSNGFTSN
ncbi:putative tail tip protein [Serratia phage vB_SmaS_Stoker]|uniref:Tail tip protein n=1 Tax=Serratia phage vB_SmaS_Stoker TaxID=2902692 RepID=A0AC61TQE0_9CAUD|nr:putative tail tip protein [Serratia phage vB_SmaS_Stoker]UGO53780.1 putative tail tip protein [Serratia phage vB_SmaS_Stoker]